MRGAQEQNREAYMNDNTLSGDVCSATKQMDVFEQLGYMKFSGSTSAVIFI